MSEAQKGGPLSGVVVLDLTSVMMGPLATSIMGDLGATIIKVESPVGDSLRHMGRGRNPAMSPQFISKNRGKSSIVLDLKNPDGRQTLLRLVEQADVLVHSMRPKTIDGLKLDYASVSAANPRIVYCGLHGFGSKGRYRNKPAYDDIIQAITGFVSLAGQASGTPAYVPVPIADQLAGLTGLYAILAALFEREKSGQGQAIEVPMFETVTSLVLLAHMQGYVYEPPTERPVYERHISRSKRPYRTKTGTLAVLVYNDKHWRNFLNAIERQDLLADERFSSMPARMRNIDHVYGFLEAKMMERSAEEWVPLLEAADIPVGPVLSTEELFSDPHLEDVNFFQTADHPTEGKIRFTAIPTVFSRTPGAVNRHAPRHGEHGAEILRSFGFDQDEIENLVRRGAVGSPASS